MDIKFLSDFCQMSFSRCPCPLADSFIDLAQSRKTSRNKVCTFTLTPVFTSFWTTQVWAVKPKASCCAAGTHHPSLSGAEQVKVMNLIQVPDKRLLFKATVPLIFRCAYWLHHGVEGSKSLLKFENNYSNFCLILPTTTGKGHRGSAMLYNLFYVRFY